MHRSIGFLGRLCRRWGGDLVLLDDEEAFQLLFYPESKWRSQIEEQERHAQLQATTQPKGYEEAPASLWHGINWRLRAVYAVKKFANPGAIIHEMGHVFACRKHPCVDETPWLGWEIVLARLAGCYKAWSKQNDSYGTGALGEHYDWVHCDQRKTAQRAIALAKQRGKLDARGLPRCVRSVRALK